MKLNLEDSDGRPWTASTNLGWMTLIVVLTFGAAAVFVALYLSLWIRSKGPSLWPLIGFIIAVAGCGLLFILGNISPHPGIADVIDNLVAVSWVAATFSLRHEIQRYYKSPKTGRSILGRFSLFSSQWFTSTTA